MSHSARVQCDDKVKNIIHHLYIVKNLPLQGSGQSVQEIMKTKYGFDKSKQQYEKLLTAWGFTKKRKREDYQVVEWKVQKRSRASAVYLDGELLPAKAWRRQGSMTVPERVNLDQDTPKGFEIRTPTAQPLSHLAFWNLPILHFQSGFSKFNDTISISRQTFESLIPIQRAIERRNMSTFMPLMSRLLPIEALRDESAATSFAVDRIENFGTTEFLAFTVYLMSNNLFGESNGVKAYEWLKNCGKSNIQAIIKLIASVEGFTSKALLENIFRLAVEAGDTVAVTILLAAGVNPDGHRITHIKILETMCPLEFACVTGNFEMARVLIEAGSNVKVVETRDEFSSFKRSLIVLSIIGRNYGDQLLFKDEEGFSEVDSDMESLGDDDSEQYVSNECSDTSAKQMSTGGAQKIPVEMVISPAEQAKLTFLEFVRFLINEGARINVDENDGSSEEQIECFYPPCLRASHSPLTAASKYRHSQVVRLLLDNGADTDYLIDGETNALQQCLTSVYAFDFSHIDFRDDMFRPRSLRNDSLPNIVRDLVNAGTDVHMHTFYGCKSRKCSCGVCLDFSLVDLATFLGLTEVLEILIEAGAKFSTQCLQYATTFGTLDVVEWLLDHGATMPYEPAKIFGHVADDVNVRAVLKRCSDRPTKRYAMLTAIESGSTSLVHCVLALGPFDWTSLLEFPNFFSYIFEHILREKRYDEARIGFGVLESLELWKTSAVIIVVTRIIGFGVLESLELWQHLNLSANNVLKKAWGMKKKVVVGKTYGELARAALKVGGNPMHHSKRWCTNTCHHLPGEDMLNIAIRTADAELVSLLIDAGVNVNSSGKMYCDTEAQRFTTPLTTAIIEGNHTLIEYFLEVGAKVNNPENFENHFRHSPLSAAISVNNAGLVRQLLNLGARFDVRTVRHLGEYCDTSYGSFRFDWQTRMILERNHDLFNIAFTHLQGLLKPPLRDRVMESMMAIAAGAENMTMLNIMLTTEKQNPISSITVVTRALGEYLRHRGVNSQSSTVQLLLDAGAEANAVIRLDCLGRIDPRSILHIAVSTGCLLTVEAILQAGGDPNASLGPSMESTALQMAIKRTEIDIIRVLLEHGADPDASSRISRYQGTPLQIAVEKTCEQTVELLLHFKADTERTNQFVAHTPLQIAAENGVESIVNLLIANGANVNAPAATDYGATALQYSVIGGFFGIAYNLVQNGADVNAAPAATGGRTALEAAAEHGRIDIVRYLLNVGAEVHGSGQGQYERALEFATSHGHHSVRELLEEYHG